MIRNKKRDIVKIIGIILFIAVGLISFAYSRGWINVSLSKNNHFESDTYIDFINCGQGDSTLIVSGENVTLVDASTGEAGETVAEHLKNRGINKIDHFVLTHPHEDHIGGAITVLDTFEVEEIYMKEPTKNTDPTTSVYINLLKKIQTSGMKINSVSVGDSFTCGKWNFKILGPIKEYKELNDQSIVLRAEYNDVSILLKGDQEADAERDLVKEYGIGLRSTIYAVGHHGSNSSSCDKLLDTVYPKYAVISCGQDNSYGHPHKETIDRLVERNIEYYRTDLNGTVTFITDGTNVKYQEVA